MPNTRPDATSTGKTGKPAPRDSAPAKRSSGQHFSKEELSRHEREVRAQKYLVMGMASIALLIVAILAFGYWRENVAKNSEPVATVAGQSIPLESYARKLDFRRKSVEQQIQSMQMQLSTFSDSEELMNYFRQQIQQLQFTLLLAPDQTLDQMIDEVLIRQEAARRGIAVTQEEIDQEIEKSFGDPPALEAAPEPTAEAAAAGEAQPTIAAEPSPTSAPATPEPTADVQARVSEVQGFYGLSDVEFRSLIEMQVLYQKLQEAMGAEVSTTADQVHARHILVNDEAKAKELVEKLRGGASFDELAKAESTDPGTKEQGGDLGWFAQGMMLPEFDAPAFSLEPNTISDPVQSTYGWHIIEVLEKEQNRQLDEYALESKKSGAISEWLGTARTSPEVQRTLSEDMKSWAYKRIKWQPDY